MSNSASVVPQYLFMPGDAFDQELDFKSDASGATLTIVRAGGAKPQDVLGFALLPGLSVDGNALAWLGETFATFTHSGGMLAIRLSDAQATPTLDLLVNFVLPSITYLYGGEVPPQRVRLVVTLNHGTAGVKSASFTTELRIRPVNAAPVAQAGSASGAEHAATQPSPGRVTSTTAPRARPERVLRDEPSRPIRMLPCTSIRSRTAFSSRARGPSTACGRRVGASFAVVRFGPIFYGS